ncbi:putative disease resistance protein RGA3 [Magnolia sinica]|uniref:putative disease resistance protein RGA3 n=1 Tax=Magnolia sinica TaxID=86752 RepID=UPI002658FA76|nr:putative disease resistance protein RGA3 [Magnolia sinica]
MGGVGKTTIAQLTYNDERVKGHFQMKMWVCVSEDFGVKQITKSSIESATGAGCGSLDLAPLQDRLHWSRIIVTTRREDVAWAIGRAHIHKLAVLSDDDCWLVFWHRALEHRNVQERSELEDIGREIVKKCGGLPLAAKTIGSAVCSKRTRREWELVLESDTWNSHDVLQGVLPALLLSYHELPPALKQCFAYFSIFPKDWEIGKDRTVKLWVAQGSDCSLVDIREQASLNLSNVRHSLLIDSDKDGDEVASIWATLYKANKLRTLLCVSRISKPRVPNNLFHHFRYHRALDLSDTSIKKLPGTVGKLK